MKYFTIMFVISCWIWSCSESEELTPSGKQDNYFEVPADATDMESVYRKEFFENTGAYLLYNDTLRHELLGEDRYGNQVFFTETIDLSWTLNENSSTKYLFAYLKSWEEKQIAGDFVQDAILTCFSSQASPYSILLVDSISSWGKNGDYGDYFVKEADIRFYIGTRCTALAMHHLSEMTENEKTNLAQQIILNIIMSSLPNYQGYLMKTYDSYANNRYGNYLFYLPAGTDVRDLGFLHTLVSYGSEICPSKTQDLEMYLELIFTQTSEEVKITYKDFPAIIAKYNLLHEILKDMGINLK